MVAVGMVVVMVVFATPQGAGAGFVTPGQNQGDEQGKQQGRGLLQGLHHALHGYLHNRFSLPGEGKGAGPLAMKDGVQNSIRVPTVMLRPGSGTVVARKEAWLNTSSPSRLLPRTKKL